ncbi:unnamed protein product, partial [Polarella glacialis]
ASAATLAALRQCSRSGNWQQAVDIVSKALNSRDTPGQLRLCMAGVVQGIAACQRGRQWERAVQVFDDALGHRLQPDVFACS